MYSVTWSPFGSLVSSCGGQTFWLWSATDGRLFKVVDGHTGSIESIDWSPRSNTVASASGGGAIWLWRIQGTLKPLRMLSGHSGAVTSIAFSPMIKPSLAPVRMQACGSGLSPIRGRGKARRCSQGRVRPLRASPGIPRGTCLQLAPMAIGRCDYYEDTSPQLLGELATGADGDWTVRLWQN
ncbi:MAG: hypothetical protein MI924_20825 [Chloroflexales bacterium]|nr:hypothetical protein [Chloroflexales bacterium]